MSDSVRSHRRQPTRLYSPWDSPGKNAGVGCHFLLQCMKVKSEVAQSCLTLQDPMDCSLPGSSAYGIFQARVLEWGATAFSKILSNSYQFLVFINHVEVTTKMVENHIMSGQIFQRVAMGISGLSLKNKMSRRHKFLNHGELCGRAGNHFVLYAG